MSVEKISLSLPSDLITEIDFYTKRKNISRSAFFKDLSKKWLLERIKKDAAELSNVKYDDLPSEEEWSVIQNECSKHYDY